MATEVTFTVDNLPDLTTAVNFASAKKAMTQWALSTWRGVVSERMSGGSGVNRRTSNLARGWVVDTHETSDGLETIMQATGSGAKYAGALERGVTITPKNGKFLWIPLAANLTGKGVARLTPRQAISEGGFVWYGHSNPVYMGAPQTKQGSHSLHMAAVPLFALVKSVTIKPTLGAAAYMQSRLPELQTSILQALNPNGGAQ